MYVYLNWIIVCREKLSISLICIHICEYFCLYIYIYSLKLNHQMERSGHCLVGLPEVGVRLEDAPQVGAACYAVLQHAHCHLHKVVQTGNYLHRGVQRGNHLHIVT
jgi:hypothetical protein